MKKSLIALALVGAFAAPVIAEEPASPHTLTANVTLATDYVFRGISQTAHEPTIQGGFDYSHASGFYVGTWASNVNWVGTKENTSMEWDLYGGYRGSFASDFTYDVGALKYYYTGNNVAGPTPGRPDAGYAGSLRCHRLEIPDPEVQPCCLQVHLCLGRPERQRQQPWQRLSRPDRQHSARRRLGHRRSRRSSAHQKLQRCQLHRLEAGRYQGCRLRRRRPDLHRHQR